MGKPDRTGSDPDRIGSDQIGSPNPADGPPNKCGVVSVASDEVYVQSFRDCNSLDTSVTCTNVRPQKHNRRAAQSHTPACDMIVTHDHVIDFTSCRKSSITAYSQSRYFAV